VPTSTPGYNSSYDATFLATYGAAPVEQWGLPPGLIACETLLRRCKGGETKGYCRVVLDYLFDAVIATPRRGCGARTTLFGIQRPPLRNGTCCLRLEKPAGANLPHQDALYDDALLYMLLFAATNAKDQLLISLDPFLSFPAFPMLKQQGLNVVRQNKKAFEASVGMYWNVVTLPQVSHVGPKYPLAWQFVSKLFPMGHVKSTSPDNKVFLETFGASAKWLRLATGGPSAKL